MLGRAIAHPHRECPRKSGGFAPRPQASGRRVAATLKAPAEQIRPAVARGPSALRTMAILAMSEHGQDARGTKSRAERDSGFRDSGFRSQRAVESPSSRVDSQTAAGFKMADSRFKNSRWFTVDSQQQKNRANKKGGDARRDSKLQIQNSRLAGRKQKGRGAPRAIQDGRFKIQE